MSFGAIDRDDLARWLERRGFTPDVRHGQGGHLAYVRDTGTGRQRLSIPQHGPKSIAPPTLASIVRRLKSFGFDKVEILRGVARGE
jgi:predicted RNA binding protein YcfA (HicA-like mRNA interferase family)